MISTIEKDEDSGELIANIPEELLDELDWRIGDEIGVVQARTGEIRLTNLSKEKREKC